MWVADAFKPSATLATPGNAPPCTTFRGKHPPLYIASLQLGIMHVHHRSNLDPQAVPCYYLSNGSHHFSTTVKALESAVGSVCNEQDVVWTILRLRFHSSSPLNGRGGVSIAPCPADGVIELPCHCGDHIIPSCRLPNRRREYIIQPRRRFTLPPRNQCYTILPCHRRGLLNTQPCHRRGRYRTIPFRSLHHTTVFLFHYRTTPLNRRRPIVPPGYSRHISMFNRRRLVTSSGRRRHIPVFKRRRLVVPPGHGRNIPIFNCRRSVSPPGRRRYIPMFNRRRLVVPPGGHWHIPMFYRRHLIVSRRYHRHTPTHTRRRDEIPPRSSQLTILPGRGDNTVHICCPHLTSSRRRRLSHSPLRRTVHFHLSSHCRYRHVRRHSRLTVIMYHITLSTNDLTLDVQCFFGIIVHIGSYVVNMGTILFHPCPRRLSRNCI